MAISLRLTPEDEKLIRDYAKINNMTVSELIRVAVIKKIEDEYDLNTYNSIINKFESEKDFIKLKNYLQEDK